jgi:hypothetical protein
MCARRGSLSFICQSASASAFALPEGLPAIVSRFQVSVDRMHV